MTDAPALAWRAVIVDDEPLARQTLRLLVAREPDFQIAAECTHGASAIECITATNPDVLFLDVQMPGMGGLEMLQRIGTDIVPLTVFVTAYDKYALQAFERHAFDYLLKPFSDERFAAVLDRLRRRLRERDQARAADHLRAMLAEPDTAQKRSLLARDGARTFILPYDDIVWIEAEDYCARIHLRDRDVLVRDSLRSLREQLPSAQFVRIHRSAIANVAAIRSLEPAASGDQRITLSDGTMLRVSRTHRAQVFDALGRRR